LGYLLGFLVSGVLYAVLMRFPSVEEKLAVEQDTATP
jgi:cytosine/uracil/thiamine/allantoin permease